MNWKWTAAAAFGLVVGILVAPFEHKTVLASVAPINPHFQMQDATVDEPNGEGQDAPRREVFLLDTESGRVWKFQGLAYGRDKDGAMKVFSTPSFVNIAVESSK